MEYVVLVFPKLQGYLERLGLVPRRDLSGVPDEKLTPRVLSSVFRYFFWATIYAAIFLSLLIYLISHEAHRDAPEYQRAMFFLMLFIPVSLVDLYIRVVFLPYFLEIRRRKAAREVRYPYDWRKSLGFLLFLSVTFSYYLMRRFLFFEEFQELAYSWAALPAISIAMLIGYFGFYHSYFVWKGK